MTRSAASLSTLLASWLSLLGCGSSQAGDSGGAGLGGGGSVGFGGVGQTDGGPGGGGVKGAVPFPADPIRPLAAPVNDPTSPTTLDALCGDVDYGATQTAKSAVANAHGMASAVRVREQLSASVAPPSESIRTEDFFNYYRAGVGAGPEPGPDALVTSATLRPLQIGGVPIPRRYELFVSIRAGAVSVRPPVALTVLVDTTPSMSGEPLTLAKESVRSLLAALRAKDHLTLLTTDSSVLFDGELADPAQAKDLEKGIALGAETTLRTPIEGALGAAKQSFIPSGWNRVVVVSDGEGDSLSLPTDAIQAAAQTDLIWLSTVGVGGGPINGDGLLFAAARTGRGSYVYVDTAGEPEKVLHQRFDELYGVVYDDVKLEVDLPWFFTLLDPVPAAGDVNPAEPQYLAPNGLMAFAFSLEACHESAVQKYGAKYKITLRNSAVDPLDPTTPMQTSQSVLVSDVIAAASTGIDGLRATRAYVSALRAPTTTRLADALELLKPLAAPGNAFEEMAQLLDAYPKKQ